MKPYVSKANTRKSCHVHEHSGITNSIRSRVISCPALNSYGGLFVALGMLTFVIVALIVQPTAHASNPTAGTLNTLPLKSPGEARLQAAPQSVTPSSASSPQRTFA